MLFNFIFAQVVIEISKSCRKHFFGTLSIVSLFLVAYNRLSRWLRACGNCVGCSERAWQRI